jgi:hypothetical protein
MTHDLPIRTVTGVDRTTAVRELPALHAVAIRLRDDGFDDHVIAVALQVDDVQVPTLLQIANRKLENLIALDDAGSRRSGIGHTPELQANQEKDNGGQQ